MSWVLGVLGAPLLTGLGVYALRQYFAGGVCRCPSRLEGKTVIVTGANSGIGKETAINLAARGARVILACRDASRGEAAAAEIRDVTGNADVHFRQLDLASLASVRKFARNFLSSESHLHILINNAGVCACPQWQTEDGHEYQLGINHLGHFLLTNLLLKLLRRSAPSRVITLASVAHSSGDLDFEDLNLTKGYTPFRAYCRSKLANVLFTAELHRRMQGTQVTCYAVHPGLVQTNLPQYSHLVFSRWTLLMWKPLMWTIFKNCTQGAQTTIHCAVAEAIEEESGHYFSDCAPKEPSPQAQDLALAAKLWQVSSARVAVKLGDARAVWVPPQVALVLLLSSMSFLTLLLFCSCFGTRGGAVSHVQLANINELEQRVFLLSKERDGLGEQLNQSQARVQDLSSHVTTSGHGAKELAVQLENVQFHNKAHEPTISELQQHSQSLQINLLEREEQVQLLQAQLTQASNQVESLDAQLMEVQGSLGASEATVCELDSQTAPMQEELAFLQQSKDQLLLEAQSGDERVHELEEQMASLREEEKVHHDNIAFKDNEIEVPKDCLVQLKALQPLRDTEAEGSDDEDAAVDEDAVKEKIQAMTDISQARAEMKQYQEETENLRNKLQVEIEGRKELGEQVSKLEEEAAHLRAGHQEAESRSKEVNTKLSVWADYFEKKKVLLQKELGVQEVLREMEDEMASYRTQVEDLKKEIENVERDFRNKIAANEQKAHENWLIARQAERGLKEAKNEASMLRQKVHELEEQMASLREEEKVHHDNIAFKDNEIEVPKDCLVQLKALQPLRDTEAEGSDDEDAAVDEDAVKEKIQAMTDISQARAEMKQYQEETENLRNKLQVEIEGRKELGEQVSKLEEEAAHLRAGHQEAESRSKEVNTKLSVWADYFEKKKVLLQKELGVQEVLREMEDEMASYRTQVEDLKKEIENVERDFRNKIAANEQKAHENWLIARQAERGLKEAKNEASMLRQKVHELEEQMASLREEEKVHHDNIAFKDNEIEVCHQHRGIAPRRHVTRCTGIPRRPGRRSRRPDRPASYDGAIN